MTAPSSLRLLRLEPARRRRLRRRRPDDRWAAVLAVGVVVGGWLLATCRSPLAPAADDAERLAHAREEARDNCLAAAFVAAGQPITAPWFQTEELRAALETSLVCAGDRGEGPALRRLARWLAALRSRDGLDDLTGEDLAFLLGGVHWYLDRAAGDGAPGSPHVRPADGYDRARMRRFRDVADFEELLGTWD